MTFTASPDPPPRSAATTAHGRRRQPPILKEPSKPSARFGEIAGGTAAVCCCFPCGLVELLVCAVVKLPAGLCRRAYVRRRRRRINAMRKKAALLGSDEGSGYGCDDDDDGVRGEEEWGIPTPAISPEAAAMEKEMLAKFYGTGFWRSPSQREDR